MANPFSLAHQIQTDDYVTSIQAYTGHGKLLAPVSSGSVQVLDETRLDVVATLSTGAPVSEVALHAATGRVYVGCMDGVIALFDSRAGSSAVARVDVGAPVLSVSTNASGTVLAAGTELVPNAGPEGEDVARLLLWDIRAGAAPLAQFIDCHSDDITQVRFHPTKDNIMMSGSTDTLINLFNITPDLNEEDSLYQVIKFNSINRLGFFGPSYEYLFAQTHVETYALYTFEEANIVKEFGDVRGMNVGGFQLEYLIDSVFDIGSGRLFLVAGTQSGNIGVLNVALNQMELAYTMNGGHRDIVRGVHWNMGGRSFVSGGEDGVVALWRN